MRTFLAIVLRVYFLLVVCSGTAFALQFQRYHSQEDIAAFLREMAQQNPELVKFQVLGHSLQGREIATVTISKNFSAETPAVYFNATHHGNEKASTEAMLGLIQYLVQTRDRAETDHLLRRYKILLQPLVNPDGHALNIRSDSQGADPNRDYATPAKAEADAFRLTETRLVRQLLTTENVVASAAFHAGLEAILWPWCHTPILSQHDMVFKTLGETVARAMSVPKFTQSFNDYQTDGEFIDYAYMRFGIYALTFEVALEPTPPVEQLDSVVRRTIQGSLSFLGGLDQLLQNSKAALGPIPPALPGRAAH